VNWPTKSDPENSSTIRADLRKTFLSCGNDQISTDVV
jgi:hypothetical protein